MSREVRTARACRHHERSGKSIYVRLCVSMCVPFFQLSFDFYLLGFPFCVRVLVQLPTGRYL